MPGMGNCFTTEQKRSEYQEIAAAIQQQCTDHQQPARPTLVEPAAE